MSRGLRKRAISASPRNMKSKTVKTSLVSFLLILGWALYLFERSTELSRSTEAVRLEVSRFLYKRFYEPRCVPPGVELGIEQSRDLTFEICDSFSNSFEAPTAGSVILAAILLKMAGNLKITVPGHKF